MRNSTLDRPSISIPVRPKESELSPSQLKDEFNLKFKDINYILLTVVVVLLIMVATLVIDSFHINSATYKEYSQKTDSVSTIQKINEQLLDQNNKNQKLIIELQQQILNKK